MNLVANDADLYFGSVSSLSFWANFVILGGEWVSLVTVTDSGLTLISRLSEDDQKNYLLIPQAWTLSLELMFYSVIPFLVGRLRLLVFLIGCSVFIRAYLYYNGYGQYPAWDTRFIGNELAIFLIGALSFLIWDRYRFAVFSHKKFVVALIAIVLVFLSNLHQTLLVGVITLGVIFMALPTLLEFQSQCRIDRLIGSLSYPIYLGHMIVIWWADSYLNLSVEQNSTKTIIVTLTGSILLAACAAFLNRSIELRFKRR